MKSKNFEFLKLENFLDYYEKIKKIEENFSVGNDLFNEVNLFLLIILNDVITNNSMEKKYSINLAIEEFRNIMLKRKHTNNIWDFDIQIWNSIKNIQKTRNEITHPGNEKYRNENTLLDKIYLLRSIHLILQYVIIEYYEKDFSILEFDLEPYLTKTEQEIFVPKNKELKYDDFEIKIMSISIGDLVLDANRFFVIPEYQRNYVWSSEACEILIDDISVKKNMNEKVYFGTIAGMINIEESENDSKKIIIKIIDGQQRITTSLIFFSVIRDILLKKISENEKDFPIPNYIMDGINKKINFEKKFFNSSMSEELNLNFKTLKKIILGENIYDVKLKEYRETNVYKNYKAIYDQLVQKETSELIQMSNFYYSNFIISLVTFDKDSTNEMEIFENLNSKGLELSTYDLIKNYLFNLVNFDEFKENSNSIVSTFDKYIFLDKKSFKNFENNSKNDDKYNAFFHNAIRYLIALETKEINIIEGDLSKNKKSILKSFKQYFGMKKLNINKYTELCRKIGKYAKIYSDINCVSINYDENTNREDWRYEVLSSLKNLASKDMTILAFYFYDLFGMDWDDDNRNLIIYEEYKKIFKRSFFEIEKWILFLLLCNGPGQSLSGTYINLIKFLEHKRKYSGESIEFIRNIPDLIKRWVSQKNSDDDEKMIKNNKLSNISDKFKMPMKEVILNSLSNAPIKEDHILKAFLRRLEMWVINRNINKPDRQIIYLKKSTLEHIMPKKLTPEWIDHLKTRLEDNRAKDWEKTAKVETNHKVFLNYIGNLLILSNSSNSSIQNQSFNEKKQFYKRENISFNNHDFSPKSNVQETIINCEIWDFKKIQDRTKKLAEILMQIYEID